MWFPPKVSHLVICGPEGTLAPLTVSIMRAEVALLGAPLSPGAPSMWRREKEGRVMLGLGD